MLDIGLSELLLILVVALIVLGPQKLPEIARKLGRGMAEFRRTSEDLRRSILLGDEPGKAPPFTDSYPTLPRKEADPSSPPEGPAEPEPTDPQPPKKTDEG